ncbi:MAG TPA: response regulator transcription factor, partial [Candidatus Acidoferrales bacterium]|nr:response regulator transcription factor [Candidatus Acidoferrales bacterium]
CVRLLLVEDERKVASFIARSLRENSYTVDVAESGEKALGLVTRLNYDLVLLDIRLPRLSGVEVCREIREAGLETPVLMLTARSLVEQRVEGLDAGADDYLTKPFALAELHARVRALTRRGFHRGGPKLHTADLELDRPRRIVKRGDQQIQLTLKEYALLELLMVRSPDAVLRSEIIEHVWSYGFDTETNIVEVYINRLRQKIDQEHPVKLIQTVRGTGYRLGLPER